MLFCCVCWRFVCAVYDMDVDGAPDPLLSSDESVLVFAELVLGDVGPPGVSFSVSVLVVLLSFSVGAVLWAQVNGCCRITLSVGRVCCCVSSWVSS